MNKGDGHNQFVRSRCKAKIYDILELNYLQRTMHTPCNFIEENRSKVNKNRQSAIKIPTTKTVKKDPSVPKLVNNKTNAKQKTECEIDSFEAITDSSIYKALSRQYSELKIKHDKISRTIKKEIISLNQGINKQQMQLSSLQNLKNSLISEVAHLEQSYEDIKLRNYELRCQLYDQRGYGQDDFYDSQQDIHSQTMDYQEMLELEQRIGKVNLGYDEKTLNGLPQQMFSKLEGEKEARCCICCEQFQYQDLVYQTACKHIHHRECIKNWLKMKRQCPLCRNDIMLP